MTGIKPIRIGIIGAGGIVTRRHLPGFAEIPGVEVIAVCNRRRKNAEAVAAEWNIPHIDDTPEALLERGEIDTILIGTTPHLHRDLTVAALEAGKHVFCQARMARNLAEARDMRDAARRHPGQVTMLCPAPHVLEGRAVVEDLLQSGELGELRLVRLRHLSQAALNPGAPFHWRNDWELSGYNVLTLGIYAEILHRWVGKAATVSATGRIFTETRTHPESGEDRQVRIPESVAVSGTLENGAHYVYTLSSVAAHSPGDAIEIYGTKGALYYDVPNQQIRLGRVEAHDDVRVGKVLAKEAPPLLEIPDEKRGGWQVEADFVAAIREGKPVFPSFDDGVDYMEFVEAVGRSMDEGRVMTLPLP